MLAFAECPKITWQIRNSHLRAVSANLDLDLKFCVAGVLIIDGPSLLAGPRERSAGRVARWPILLRDQPSVTG
jgi:hypothetical protein